VLRKLRNNCGAYADADAGGVHLMKSRTRPRIVEAGKPVWRYRADDAVHALPIREQFAEALAGLAPECAALGAEIVFSELVSNVVKHAPGPIDVEFEVLDGRALLHVRDEGPGFLPHPSVPTDLFAESGRGLVLVQEFCTELRVQISSLGGTCVTAVFEFS
jgi:anti-sigma regulatory factor (Ser/Thr protein kinase)